MKKILTLNGGGSLGIYSLGVLFELEGFLKETKATSIHEYFDSIYGVSTGGIIATFLSEGKSVEEIKEIYLKEIPYIMTPLSARKKSKRLREVIYRLFSDYKLEETHTDIAITAVNYTLARPQIFKSNKSQIHHHRTNFKPFFGYPVTDVLIASSSAYPYFEKFKTEDGEIFIDGGFFGSNPTFSAMIDLEGAYKEDIINANNLILNIGTGNHSLSNLRTSFWMKILFLMVSHSDMIKDIVDLPATLFQLSNESQTIFRTLIYPELSSKQLITIDGCNYPHNLKTNMLEHRVSNLKALYKLGAHEFKKRLRVIEERFI